MSVLPHNKDSSDTGFDAFRQAHTDVQVEKLSRLCQIYDAK
jgi:hypothetical protein